MQVFPKTSIFNLCYYLFDEVHENKISKKTTNVETTLKMNLRAMIPIVSDLLKNEIDYFHYNNSIDLQSTSKISDENCDGDTTKTFL